MRPFFRRALGMWPNLVVISYTLLGWPLGIWMMVRPEIALNITGVLLTAHTLIYSAYLIHDCAHHAVFPTASANDRLGLLMSWINGACLADYSRLKKKHLRHHFDRLDVVTFDYRAALRRTPAWVRHLALALEWAYVPSVEFLMRGMVFAAPFSSGTRGERIRVLLSAALRLAFFAALAWVSHNAHHVRPSMPWYRLPGLHRSLYGEKDPQVITCRHLVASYHRHRVARVLAENYGSVSAAGNRAGGFLGAVGVSFLTAV